MKLKKRKDKSFLFSIFQKKLLVITVGVVFLDQSIKYFALHFLPFVCNRGVAFGVPGGSLVFLGVILAIILCIVYFENSKKNILALALIFAGGLSNFVDRVIFGCVRDFIDFGTFPVFNFADVVISLGMALMIFNLMNTKNEA